MDKNGMPDTVNQLPATGNPMEPQSGTYGTVADTERLKQQLSLPGGGPTGPGGAAMKPTAPPPGIPQGTQITPPPGGVPDVLMAPTTRPDVPASTPLQNAFAGAPAVVTGAQRRLSILHALSTSEEVSEETREWAQLVLDKLASRQA